MLAVIQNLKGILYIYIIHVYIIYKYYILLNTKSKSHYDRRSVPVSLDVRPPFGTRDQIFLSRDFLQTVAGMLFCSALSAERTDL
jgi:hypothetical protein